MQADAWRNSHHALAMQPARADTVLGNFNDRTFTYGDVTSTFFRRDNKYYVRTDGPDGSLQDFEIQYTFGVEPLQQYLIELERGKLQPLAIAWDSRPANAGGQRWFHLYPDQAIGSADELHWTSPQQNWNFMCADCHSTNVRKNYDAATDSYRTAWSEINVGCEACHGPGSRHADWAKSPAWLRATLWKDSRLAAKPGMEVCAQCHSRRAQIADGYVSGAPLHDYYIPALLEPGLYYPDGQQRDEVYVYGSFLQSRMYREGVTCSDCHEPHTQKLRTQGNGLCAQCHAPDKFDTTSHHFHNQGQAGGACVSCHMPETTYMVVDGRRDHSFSVPRPDQSVKLGVPNACTGCHSDRSAMWAADTVRRWYGRDAAGSLRFAEALSTDAGLVSLAADPSLPPIVRATALQRLGARASPASLAAAAAALRDADPMLRRAALFVYEALPVPERSKVAASALRDPSRSVRLQAAWLLARTRPMPRDTQAFEEFIASQRYNADRPESRASLGTFLTWLGRRDEGSAELRSALKLSPKRSATYVNLADIFRAEGNEPEAERTLREGLSISPEDATLHYALGLSLARSGQSEQALEALKRAVTLMPDSETFVYAYALGLHSSGQRRDAIRLLEQTLARHPGSRDFLFALATFHRDDANIPEAVRFAQALLEAFPEDLEAQALLQALKR